MESSFDRGLQAAPAAHILAASTAVSALRPAAAPHVLTLELVQALVGLALSTTEAEDVCEAAGLAAACMLNKWPAGVSPTNRGVKCRAL